MKSELSHEQEKSVYAHAILQGCSVEFGKLSLCDLTNFRHSQVKTDRKYQVHCDDTKHLFSGIYEELMPAVNQFMYIKQRVGRRK